MWARDKDLGVRHLQMIFKAMRLDEVTKRLSVDSEEKMLEDLSLGPSIVQRAGRRGRGSKGYEKEQLLRKEENQECGGLEAK